MTCEQFVAHIRASLDHELSTEVQRDFDWHAADCNRCAAFLAAYRETIKMASATVGEGRDKELPEDLVQSIMDEIRKAKNPN
jgi:hypothetical protein